MKPFAPQPAAVQSLFAHERYSKGSEELVWLQRLQRSASSVFVRLYQ
jgi:hypothetical protein